MKRGSARLALLIALLVCVASIPATADETELTDRYGDLISVFGGDINVPAHVRQYGQVVSIGGKLTIDGEVAGDVVVVLGRLEGSGHVDGQVAAILSDQVLSGAQVDGEYVSVLGTVELNETNVAGEFINILSRLERDAISTAPLVNLGAWIPGLVALLWWWRLLRLFLVFLVLVLIVALTPERVRLIGEETPARYVTAFFTGLLGYLALLAIWVLLMMSVVGIPFFFLAYWPLKWLGIAGLFYACGRRAGRVFGREMSVLGAVLGTFAIYALVVLAPTPLGLWGLPVSALLGAAFFLAVEVPAIGLLILTRVGTRRGQDRPPVVPRAASALVPPAVPG